MPRPGQRIRAVVKQVLDRRYATKIHLERVDSVVETAEERLRIVEVEIAALRSDLLRLTTRLEAMDARLAGDVEQGTPSASQLDEGTNSSLGQVPDLADCVRLTNECARAIELLLQQEVLIKRDLNAIRTIIDR